MSSPSLESRIGDRHGVDTVPLILSEFPVPPSHIPPTPLSATFPGSPNPPPSLPPSSPLPPVPGPSPISEYDTLKFISAARSRRASKLSLASSSYSRRDSTGTLASVTSTTSTSPRSPAVSLNHADKLDGSRSIRSFSSAGSVSSLSRRYMFEKSPTLEPQIREEDTTDLTHMSIDEFGVITPMPLESEISGEESVPDISLATSLSRRRPASRSHRAGLNDSISSIDMRDLPALQEDELEPLTAPPVLPVRMRPDAELRMKHPRPPTAIMNKDLPPIPHTAPPGSRAPSSWPESDSSSTPTSAPLRGRFAEDVRSDSPDITAIIASTPRPRRKSSSLYSSGSRAGSMSNRSSRTSSMRRSSGATGKRFSEGLAVPVPKVDMNRISGTTDLAYHRHSRHTESDGESDYGELPMDGTGTAMDIAMLDKEAEARLERQLDGVGTESEGEGSDSSIDVQTPLPHLMLRDGMLSPHSKLLPHRQTTPHDKHLSVESSASVMTKSGIFKDQRDTHRRRARHRDGALLRGGIGLTTGLGWSDSEDEDAPSLLTRRVSSMVLSRRASQTSVTSSVSRKKASLSKSTPHPLSRSVSETLSSASKSLAEARQRHPSLPPTSWQGASSNSRSARTSAGSLYSDGHMSLSDIREREKDDSGIMTPSSASSSSLPMPLTPGDDDAPATWSSTPMRRIPSNLNMKASMKPSAESSIDFPRERTQLSSSTMRRIGSMPLTTSPESTPLNTRTPIPRPLKLGSSLGSKPSLSNLRAPSVTRSSLASCPSPALIPTPRTPGPASRLGPPISPLASSSRLSRPPAVSDPKPISPTRPMTPGDPTRPKPRTGTGMVYRTGTSASRQTMMRQPSTILLRSQSSKGI